MVDSMVVREMNRRCNYDIDQLIKISDLLLTDKRPRVPDHQLNKTNFITVRDIEIHLTKPNQIGQLGINYLTRLEKLITEILLQSKPFELVCIHDAFKASPVNMNTVRYWYKEILAELADSHLMQSIIQQIHKDTSLTLTRASENLGDLIRQSNYGIA